VWGRGIRKTFKAILGKCSKKLQHIQQSFGGD